MHSTKHWPVGPGPCCMSRALQQTEAHGWLPASFDTKVQAGPRLLCVRGDALALGRVQQPPSGPSTETAHCLSIVTWEAFPAAAAAHDCGSSQTEDVAERVQPLSSKTMAAASCPKPMCRHGGAPAELRRARVCRGSPGRHEMATMATEEQLRAVSKHGVHTTGGEMLQLQLCGAGKCLRGFQAPGHIGYSERNCHRHEIMLPTAHSLNLVAHFVCCWPSAVPTSPSPFSIPPEMHHP